MNHSELLEITVDSQENQLGSSVEHALGTQRLQRTCRIPKELAEKFDLKQSWEQIGTLDFKERTGGQVRTNDVVRSSNFKMIAGNLPFLDRSQAKPTLRTQRKHRV